METAGAMRFRMVCLNPTMDPDVVSMHGFELECIRQLAAVIVEGRRRRSRRRHGSERHTGVATILSAVVGWSEEREEKKGEEVSLGFDRTHR